MPAEAWSGPRRLVGATVQLRVSNDVAFLPTGHSSGSSKRVSNIHVHDKVWGNVLEGFVYVRWLDMLAAIRVSTIALI